MPRAIRGVKRAHGHENVRHHAMGKLHGKVIVEEIEPSGRKQEQMLTRRNERTVNQWPGIVDKTRFEPGDEPTKRNLSEQEDQYRYCAHGKPPGRDPRRAIRSRGR